MREVPLEACAEHLVRGELDVVLDALELELLLVRVVDRVARAVVEVAGLADRADRDDVLLVRLELEIHARELLDRRPREREHLAEVGVADERQVADAVEDREALASLLWGEDVLELLEANRGAMTEEDADLVEPVLVRKALEPRHVVAADHRRMSVERVAGGLVVVRVIHPPRDRGVVVAEDGGARQL